MKKHPDIFQIKISEPQYSTPIYDLIYEFPEEDELSGKIEVVEYDIAPYWDHKSYNPYYKNLIVVKSKDQTYSDLLKASLQTFANGKIIKRSQPFLLGHPYLEWNVTENATPLIEARLEKQQGSNISNKEQRKRARDEQKKTATNVVDWLGWEGKLINDAYDQTHQIGENEEDDEIEEPKTKKMRGEGLPLMDLFFRSDDPRLNIDRNLF